MDKQKLQQQIADLEAKLAELKAEVNKPAPIINYWKPAEGDNFFYVDAWGSTRQGFANDDYTPRYRIFKTQEEAQAYLEYVKAEEALKAEIARLNEGWWPDWNNNNQIKCFIYLGNHLDWSSCFTNKRQPNFTYLKSRTLANQLIQTHSKELITYLSY